MEKFFQSCLILFFGICGFAEELAPPPTPQPNPNISNKGLSVSTNPSTVNIVPGTGELGELLFKRDADSGVRLGGILVSDGDVTLTGGVGSEDWSGNNLVVIGLDLNFEKLNFWKGGSFGIAYLQFNGMDSNGRAGVVQGFDSMPVVPPFTNRSELYEVWIRQEFLDKKLVIRVGKTVPTYDFNNVIRPVPVQDTTRVIPGVSSLLFSPVFINPVNIGVLPGYYNSAYGVTVNIAPTNHYYLSLGAYDGSLATGTQTGLRIGPNFNGHYFCIAETGGSWFLGEQRKPGSIGIGGWVQTGKLSIPTVATQNGAQGAYLFGAQRVWFRKPNIDDSGISVYWQLGYNHAKTLPMTRFVGGGLTAFALTRPKDSFGFGVAWSWLNHRLFTRRSELMFQAYYQAHCFHTTYLEPVLSYIPTPGGGNNLPQTVTATLQMITLF
jgi:porin